MNRITAVTLAACACSLSPGVSVSRAADDPALSPEMRSVVNKVATHESRIQVLESQVHDLQMLLTRNGPFTQTASAEPSGKSHTIGQGDTVSSIAQTHNVSRASLMKLNNIKDGQIIYIGDVLRIPGGDSAQPLAPQPKSTATSPTLAQNTPAPEPKPAPAPAPAPRWEAKATPIKAEIVSPAPAPKPTEVAGTETKPSAPKPAPAAPSRPESQPEKASATAATAAFVSYKVKFGDTLSRIAKAHNTTVDLIMTANGISNANLIQGGQTLKIPSGKEGKGAPAVASAPTPAPAATPKAEVASSAQAAPQTPASTAFYDPSESYGLYTVQKGDTLFSLARDFFTSEDEIKRLNALNSPSLQIGQELTVPTSKYYSHHKMVAQN